MQELSWDEKGSFRGTGLEVYTKKLKSLRAGSKLDACWGYPLRLDVPFQLINSSTISFNASCGRSLRAFGAAVPLYNEFVLVYSWFAFCECAVSFVSRMR